MSGCSCTRNSLGVPIPSSLASKYCTKCCSTAPAPSCEAQCVSSTINVALECNEEELISNGCTLLTTVEMVEDKKCVKVYDLITSAYNRASDTRNCPKEVAERYLDLYNLLALQISDELEGVRHPRQALISTCGYCEFNKPPDLKFINSLSNEVAGCNANCKTRRYSYIPVSQFFGSKLINSYTIRGDKIFIKSPHECGCSEGIPNILLIDYMANAPKAVSLDDCLSLTDEQYLGIYYLLVIDIAAKLEKTAVQARFEKLYEKFSQNHGSYDQQQLSVPSITGRASSPVNWHSQG